MPSIKYYKFKFTLQSVHCMHIFNSRQKKRPFTVDNPQDFLSGAAHDGFVKYDFHFESKMNY